MAAPAPQGHAKLSPSSSHRWMRCPGSVGLTDRLVAAGVVDPDTSSENADEGTFAHAIAAEALTTKRRAETFLGRVSDCKRFTVDEDMARHLQSYLDAVAALMLDDGTLLVETRVDAVPGVHGTADAIVLCGDVVHVVDLKFGAGVFVEVADNPQLLTYALGVRNRLEGRKLRLPNEWHLHVVQPRHTGARPWRTAVVSDAALLAFKAQLIEAAVATRDADAPLCSGDHCRWCPVKAHCPELRRIAVASAEEAFASPPVAPSTSGLSNVDVAFLLPRLDVLEDWISAVRSHAYKMACAGVQVEGYKLVQKVGHRAWINDAPVAEKLLASGVDPHQAPELVSPAEAERRLGGKKKAAAVLAGLVHTPSTGTALVPITDKRPPVAAVTPFEAIPQ